MKKLFKTVLFAAAFMLLSAVPVFAGNENTLNPASGDLRMTLWIISGALSLLCAVLLIIFLVASKRKK